MKIILAAAMLLISTTAYAQSENPALDRLKALSDQRMNEAHQLGQTGQQLRSNAMQSQMQSDLLNQQAEMRKQQQQIDEMQNQQWLDRVYGPKN